MQNHHVDDSNKIVSDVPVEKNCHSPKDFYYDEDPKELPLDDSIEGTVNWIEKDCESKSEEYLEECNTHKNGE